MKRVSGLFWGEGAVLCVCSVRVGGAGAGLVPSVRRCAHDECSARWRRQRQVKAQGAPRCAQTAVRQQQFDRGAAPPLASATAYGLLHTLAQSLYMSSGGAS